MAAPTIQVLSYFGIDATTSVFVLDDSTRGLLDGATYVLGGDVGIDISTYVKSIHLNRGRERAIDDVNVGVAGLTVNNETRIFDPLYAAGTYFGKIKPGLPVTILANGIPRMDGKVDDWDFTYPLGKDSTASFDVVDVLADLGSAEFDAWTGTAFQATGGRIVAALDRTEVGFPSGLRAIDTGTSTLQADAIAWGTNVLNYCQKIAKCDVGQLFATRGGVLTFYGRNRTFTGVGAVEFRDDGTAGSIPYSGIEVDYGTELIFNRVSVDATGFTKQTATSTSSYQAFNKWWSLSLSALPLETQAQALDVANYLLNLYANPVSRIASITVPLHRFDTGDQNTVLNLDIGSVIRVVYTPNGVSPAIDQFCMIEGVTEDIAPAFHSVTFKLSNLADGFGGHPFTLDDATYGLLDGTAGRLAF